MNKKSRLKKLRAQIASAKTDTEQLKLKLVASQRLYEAKRDHLKTLDKALNQALKEKTLIISDHARLRYLERVKGVDISNIDQEILNTPTLKLVETLGGDGSYPSGEFVIIMKDFTVVTVIARD